MKFISDIAKLLIPIATFSLFFRRGIFKPYTLQPFEILIWISFILTILYLAIYKSESIKKNNLHYWIKIFTLFSFIFLIPGIFNAYSIYGLDEFDIKTIEIVSFKFITYIIAILLIIYYGNNKKFRLSILYSFMSSFLMIPFLFLDLKKLETTFFDVRRLNSGFYGFHSYPTSFAYYLLPSIILLVILFIKSKNKLFYWLLILPILSILIYTGGRGAWLSLFFSLSFILFAILKNTNKKEKRKIILSLPILALVTATISFLILPSNAKVFALNRIFPQITERFYVSENNKIDLKKIPSSNIDFKKATSIIIENPNISIHQQDRKILWPQAIKLLIKNPWGLGPSYANSSKGIINARGFPTVSHNAFLQIALTSGILGLISFLCILYKLFIKLKNCNKKNLEWLVLCAIGIGYTISLLFDDRFGSEPWLMIFIGLIIAYTNKCGEIT